MRNSVRQALPLLLILLVALAVRLVGINWGLPFVYHVDESTLVRSALGMRFGDFNPHTFIWPSLYRYLCFLLFEVFIKLRVPFQILFGVETMQRVLPFWWGSTAPFYLLARVLTAVLDVGTVAWIYLIGKRLFGRSVGILAAATLAVSFASVYGGHYNRLEVPATFFAVGSLYFATRVFEGGKFKDYLLAGLFAGLATSTKYNAGFVVVAVIVAHLLRRVGPIRGIPGKKLGAVLRWWLVDFEKLTAAGAATVVSFLAGTPFALLDSKTFLSSDNTRGFLGQVATMGRGLNWWSVIRGPLVVDWGLPMAILFLVGVVWAVRQHRAKDILLLSSPLVYFLYVGSWGITGGHYLLPLYPPLAILTANFLLEFLKPRLGRWLTGGVLAAALLFPLAKALAADISGLRGDTRNLAYAWVLENIPPQSRLAIDGKEIPSYLGGSLPILPRAEGSERGYFLVPWQEAVLKYGRSAEVSRQELARRQIGYYLTSSFENDNLNETFYRYLAEEQELLAIFAPRWLTGPEIKIYRISY